MLMKKPNFTKYISDFLTEKSFSQFKRYLITGFTSFAVEYMLYIFLYKKLNFHYIVASSLVYLAIFWFVFLVNRFWSFKSKGNIKKQLLYYCLLFVFNILVSNILLMYLLTDVLGIHPYISQVLKMGAVVSWNFILYKEVIYK